KSLRNSIETTPRIIVFTGNASPDVPRQVMQLGGAGFCSKSESPERLIETVLAVSEGRMVFPFMDMSKPGGDPFGTLTKREQELLSALAEGRTNGQIAEDLGISLNTVKFHLKNLYGKLSVRNRAQAVATFLTAHRP
ncbi:MAG: response regulator transcription factor, partial [Rhodospirillaceae bacterium]|nr:response regulator transcription factor [Rhodospirillaceae bacterium]